MNQKQGIDISKGRTGGFIAWLGEFFVQHPLAIGAALAILWFGIFMLPQRDDPNDWHYRAFGRLPVIDQGRYKPMDTSARMSLMLITHRQQFYDAEDKTTYPATKWYLDAATVADVFRGDRAPAYDFKIFRIENDQVLRMLDLKMRDGLRYSYSEIMTKNNEAILVREAVRLIGDEERDIPGIDPKDFSLFDAKVMELWQHLQIFKKINGHAAPLVIPTADGSDQWKSLGGYMNEIMAKRVRMGDDIDARSFEAYLKLMALYGGADPDKSVAERKKEFNDRLSAHLAELTRLYPAKMRAIDTEIFFNEFAPFYRCLEVYVAIALFTALSWLTTTWGASMRRAAYGAMLAAFAFHLVGLLLRMYLQNRYGVFVTNLYSSAVFIGFGCVAMCLIVEAIYKNGIAIVVGSVLGFLTLIIAHLLSTDGDTMTMMQAVLDTNFWLATHVTCVTLGYMTVFVAGFMGIAYILAGIFTGGLRGEGGANLTRMTYGVLCTGMFFSFVGTVLGGLWADYSWGRFWGWDPKENGRLADRHLGRVDPARPLGRHHQAARHRCFERHRHHRHHLVVVRHQLPRRRPARLRRRQGLGHARHGADRFPFPGHRGSGDVAARALAELPAGAKGGDAAAAAAGDGDQAEAARGVRLMPLARGASKGGP